MSKIWMKRFALIIVLVLMVMMISPAGAVFALPKNYVALGDSISYGLTDIVGFDQNVPIYGGYTRMYHANYLGTANYTYLNLSMPGDATPDLMDVISNNYTAIRTAHVFTISIGSNNLLGPFIAAVTGLYDIESSAYPEDQNGAQMLADLAEKIKIDWTDGGSTPVDRLSWLMDPTHQEYWELNKEFVAGTALFALQWPVIMARIRLRAPLAKVYVNNLYNPLLASKLADMPEDLYNMVGLYISRINNNITRYASLYRYRIVNVYSAFNNQALYTDPTKAPLSFNIPAVLTIAGPAYDPATDFPKFFLAADPHPTTAGHQLIFEKLVGVSY